MIGFKYKMGDLIIVNEGIDKGWYGLVVELVEGNRYLVWTKPHYPTPILLHESQMDWTPVCDEENPLAEDL